MFVELHLLQSFAPSNLNRDDTGSPKDCEFGGVRRARISSQCLKRAVRTAMKDEQLLPPEALAERTKLVSDAITQRLIARGHDEAQARAVAEVTLRGAGLDVEDGKTEYLLFLGRGEIEALARLCHEYWGQLTPLVSATTQVEGPGRTRKQAGKDALPKEIAQAARDRLNGGKAADLALFGRMLADLPTQNVEAASQVAHAISTHKVSVEFDFYTAVDDLQARAETGAGMMGTVEFNSACYYRYANVDVDQLERNLDGDRELALKTLGAFMQASIDAIPTGKQNSMAAQNLPAFVLAVVRERGLWSLANAFEKPVRANGDAGLVEQSIVALDAQWGKLARVYGENGQSRKWVVQTEETQLSNLGRNQVASVRELIANVLKAVEAGSKVGGLA
jgi:CRISPR system Cascade subunit CasC